MKTLYLVRHAKSSWKEPALSDHERPLNKRGKKDAPFMGKLLKKKAILPQLIVSSPAKRALTTAKIMAGEMGYPKKKIREDERIYDNAVRSLMSVIGDTEDVFGDLMIFGHNPSFTELAEYLSNEQVENIPTSGVFAIDFDVDSWKAIDGGKGTCRFFEYPKKYA